MLKIVCIKFKQIFQSFCINKTFELSMVTFLKWNVYGCVYSALYGLVHRQLPLNSVYDKKKGIHFISREKNVPFALVNLCATFIFCLFYSSLWFLSQTRSNGKTWARREKMLSINVGWIQSACIPCWLKLFFFIYRLTGVFSNLKRSTWFAELHRTHSLSDVLNQFYSICGDIAFTTSRCFALFSYLFIYVFGSTDSDWLQFKNYAFVLVRNWKKLKWRLDSSPTSRKIEVLFPLSFAFEWNNCINSKLNRKKIVNSASSELDYGNLSISYKNTNRKQLTP